MNRKTWKEDPFMAAGFVLCVILGCFILVWSTEKELTALEKMWAILIFCSTAWVMLYFTGSENKRARQTIEAMTTQAVQVAALAAEVKLIKESLPANGVRHANGLPQYDTGEYRIVRTRPPDSIKRHSEGIVNGLTEYLTAMDDLRHNGDEGPTSVA